MRSVTVTVTEALVLRPLLEDRGRITVNPYPGARRQNETEMFSDHDRMSSSIAAVSAPGMGTRRKSSRLRRDRDAQIPRPRRWLH